MMVVCIGRKGRRLYAISLLFALLIACVRVDLSQGGGDDESTSHPNRFDDANRIQSIENLASAIRSSLLNDGKLRNAKDVSSSVDNNRRTRRKKRRNMKEPSSFHSQEERGLIVGGSTAALGRFPYLVSLQLEEANNGDDELTNAHTCGATLVAMDVVLTAGHCGYKEVGPSGKGGNANFGENPKQLFYGADVGAYNLKNGFTGTSDEVDNLLFEKLVLHPKYTGFHVAEDGYRLQHDVMLVKLYGGSEKPVVRLHNPNTDPEPSPFEELSVLGWGDTDPAFGEPDLPNILQYASVSYIPNDICENFNGYALLEGKDDEAVYFNYKGKVSSDMMCAVNWDGQDACQGDSGGGMIRLGSAPNGENDVQMGSEYRLS